MNINARDGKGNTRLINAVKHGDIENILELIGSRVNVNVRDKYEKTALMVACHWKHEDIVKLLLKTKGVDVNAQDGNGYTTLMMAILSENWAIAKLLLEVEGVDVNLQNEDEDTALMMADEDECTKIAEMIRKKSTEYYQKCLNHLKNADKSFPKEINCIVAGTLYIEYN